jgi:hypothetical protein
MNDLEKMELAKRLAEVSPIFDEGAAKEVIDTLGPEKAKTLIKAREEGRERQAEISRSRERLRFAAYR